MAALSGRSRCLRPDAYGCGGSPPPPPKLSLDGWAQRLLDRLDAAGVEGRFAVAGSSMGGYLALALLRLAPERIAALALLGSRAGADTPAARAERLRLAARVREGGAAAVEALAESQPAILLAPAALGEFHVSDPVRGRVRRCSAAGVEALLEALASRPDSHALLPSVAVPTLVVHGSADAAIPVAEALAMAAAIPGARLAVLEGAGHLVNVERPEEVSRRLGELVDAAAW